MRVYFRSLRFPPSIRVLVAGDYLSIYQALHRDSQNAMDVYAPQCYDRRMIFGSMLGTQEMVFSAIYLPSSLVQRHSDAKSQVRFRDTVLCVTQYIHRPTLDFLQKKIFDDPSVNQASIWPRNQGNTAAIYFTNKIPVYLDLPFVVFLFAFFIQLFLNLVPSKRREIYHISGQV